MTRRLKFPLCFALPSFILVGCGSIRGAEKRRLAPLTRRDEAAPRQAPRPSGDGLRVAHSLTFLLFFVPVAIWRSGGTYDFFSTCVPVPGVPNLMTASADILRDPAPMRRIARMRPFVCSSRRPQPPRLRRVVCLSAEVAGCTSNQRVARSTVALAEPDARRDVRHRHEFRQAPLPNHARVRAESRACCQEKRDHLSAAPGCQPDLSGPRNGKV